MKTFRIGLPALEHLESSLRVFDRLEIHNGIRSIVPRNTSNDPSIEAANVLGADGVEQVFDVLVRVRHVRLCGIMTKSVDVVDYDPGGGVGLVVVARRKEVDGRKKMAGSWNLELVTDFGLEGSSLALLENATLNTSRIGRLALRLLGHDIHRRTGQSLINILGLVELLGSIKL